ncbi:hypothetical protein EV715DRAFT_273986 [Schizophyllum commune]
MGHDLEDGNERISSVLLHLPLRSTRSCLTAFLRARRYFQTRLACATPYRSSRISILSTPDSPYDVRRQLANLVLRYGDCVAGAEGRGDRLEWRASAGEPHRLEYQTYPQWPHRDYVLTLICLQLLATRIIDMQCELEFACRERDRYRDDCRQVVGERDRLIEEHDRYRADCHHLAEERDRYKAQRDHYRTERDRYRDQRNYLRDLLKQEMGNKDAARRAEETLVAVEKSNGRFRGGVVGEGKVVGGGEAVDGGIVGGGREEMTQVEWEERVTNVWPQASMSSVSEEVEEQEDVPLDFVWDPASQALSSSVAVRPIPDGREEAPSASLAWEEERSAMVMDELGLFDDDDDDDNEGEHEDVRDGIRVTDNQDNAQLDGENLEGSFDASAEDLYVDDTRAAAKSPALRLGSPEADFSSYPVLDSSMYPAPGALSPPSPSVSLPPSPTLSGQTSFASSAHGSSEKDCRGSSSSQERPSTPSPRRSLPLRLRDRAGWGIQDEWMAEEAEGAQTRIDPRRCVEDSLGEDYRGGFTDEGTFEDCPEDHVQDYTEEYATAMDDEAQASDHHIAPDYSLVLDGLEDFCLGARGGLNESGGSGARSANGSPATHNKSGGPGALNERVAQGGLADNVGPGFRHASTDDQLLNHISLSSLNLGVHCDLSEEMEMFGAGMALLGGRGGLGTSVGVGPEGANPVLSRPSADAGLRQSRTNVGNSPSGTTVSTHSNASNADESSGWYGDDGQRLKRRHQHAEVESRQHQADDILYQTGDVQHMRQASGSHHLTGTAQVKMADVLYQTPGEIVYHTSGVRHQPALTSDIQPQQPTDDIVYQSGDTLYQTSGFQHQASDALYPTRSPSHRPDLSQRMWPSGYTPENSNWFEDGYDPAEDVYVAAADGSEVEAEVEEVRLGKTEEQGLEDGVSGAKDEDVPADDNDAVHDSQEADHAGFIDDLGAGDHYDDPVWENADDIEESAEADWDLPAPRYGCLGRAPRGFTRGGGMNRVSSTQSLWDAWDGADDDDEEWDGEGDDKSFVTC